MIGIGNDPVFDREAHIRESVGIALELAPHPAERVEGHHNRRPERAFEIDRDQGRHPEIGVDQVVPPPSAAHPAQHERAELIHPGQELFLGDGRGWPGRDVHHADAGSERDHLRASRILAAGKHVNLVSHAGEMTRELRDVDVLTTTIRAARLRQWRRMLADHGDAPLHAAALVVVAGRADWALTSSSVSVQSRAKRSM